MTAPAGMRLATLRTGPVAIWRQARGGEVVWANEAYFAHSTADAKFPKITLSSGEEVTVSYGQYRAILSTRREHSGVPHGVRRVTWTPW